MVGIESVWAEKGCRPAAYFIDATSGAVVEAVDLDHRWSHELDVQPAQFDGSPIRVERVERVAITEAAWNYGGNRPTFVPWMFVVVRGSDPNDDLHSYAYELATKHLNGRPDPGWNILPEVGSTIEIGTLKRGARNAAQSVVCDFQQ